MLRLEIFVHWDKQLRASHLILRIDPVYSTWQAFGQALLVDSPLLSYIDVRYVNFLPLRLIVGEARDLGPRYTCLDKLAPIRDESADCVSRRRREQVHVQVEQEALPQAEPEAPAQAEETTFKSVSSSETKYEMMTRKVMTISRFVLVPNRPNSCNPPSSSSNSPSSSPKSHSKKATYGRANPNLGALLSENQHLRPP